MEHEVWKPIKGFEGYYEVSNLGKVRGLERVSKYTGVKGKECQQIIKAKDKVCSIGNNGYISAPLCKNNKTYNTLLHRILAEAFIPNPLGLKVINHKNGIKTDNRLINLEWCTSAYNNKHAIDNRLRRASNAIIDEKLALKLREMRKQKLTYVEIAKIVGISKGSIGAFLRGANYKYLKV